MDGMMAAVRWDGMKVGDQTYHNSARAFSLGSFDLGAMSSPEA